MLILSILPAPRLVCLVSESYHALYMQIPTRRSQQLRIHDDGIDSRLLTPKGLEKLKRTLRDLEDQRPQTVKDLSEAIAKGDLSENAEYTESKARLGRIDGRIFSLKERIKNAVIIEAPEGDEGTVQLGSTVTVLVNARQRAYQIVGPSETDPSKGRISHLSPLGQALMAHKIDDVVQVNGMDYRIIAVE